MSTKLDVRQSQIRTLLDQIGFATPIGLDAGLASINSELTPLCRLIASQPNSLVLNIGAGNVVNPITGRTRRLPAINTIYVNFTGGTVTFPSTSGGSITPSSGSPVALVVPSGQFVKVLVQINSSASLDITVGTPAGSPSAAAIPLGLSTSLSIGYVTISNIAGTIQNIADSVIFQFIGGSGAGSSFDPTTILVDNVTGQVVTSDTSGDIVLSG